MKSRIVLAASLLALVLSSASLAVSLRTSRLDQKEIDRRVDLAIRAKEKDWVDTLYPDLDRMYNAMLKGSYVTPKDRPETLKEAFRPMLEVLKNLT